MATSTEAQSLQAIQARLDRLQNDLEKQNIKHETVTETLTGKIETTRAQLALEQERVAEQARLDALSAAQRELQDLAPQIDAKAIELKELLGEFMATARKTENFRTQQNGFCGDGVQISQGAIVLSKKRLTAKVAHNRVFVDTTER